MFLPIDPHIPEILEEVRRSRRLVVVAPPGAGKTTRIPPALTADGPVILLQPRRIAARSLAKRIAFEQGWTIGKEIGWQVRFERNFSRETRLLVATEGVLTARLQSDPLLSAFRTVVLDEFHERSIHADLALALVRQAAEARDDLRVVVMSATLDAGAVSTFLSCRCFEIDVRAHPVDVQYSAGATPAAAIITAATEIEGDVLCFLPGAGEIGRVALELENSSSRFRRPSSSTAGPGTIAIHPLHGSLAADEQEAALAPSPGRKVILATNLAETSLTVEGVRIVIDSGLHKVLRYDPSIGIDRLETERIPLDSADQRAGRAGRLGPGVAIRLWDPRDILRPHREPEIARIDLAPVLLDVLAWGGDPFHFEWFEAPPQEKIELAFNLLERLGAIEGRGLSRIGDLMRKLPVHPRLARVLISAGGSRTAAAACAIIGERTTWATGRGQTTNSDVATLVDAIDRAPRAIRDGAKEIARIARDVLGPSSGQEDSEGQLRRALLDGYPDRVAKRREPGSARVLLATGHGAVFSKESGVREAELVVAIEVTAGVRGIASDSMVRIASAIERSWLEPTHRDIEHTFDESGTRVIAHEIQRYDRIPLGATRCPPDRQVAERLLVDSLLARRGEIESQAELLRIRFAGLTIDFEEIVRAACHERTELPRIDWLAAIPPGQRRDLERLAPEAIEIPSGRQLRLEYREDGAVVGSVRIQELFGLAESPRLGPRQEAVLLELLAPNGRLVQTTRDLRGFWETTYAEVRRELRGRYPKHPWPEDPWTAVATSKTKKQLERIRRG